MDGDNLRNLREMRGRVFKDGRRGLDGGKGEIRLFGEFGGRKTASEKRRGGRRGVVMVGGEEVVDPYYGEDDGFEVCFEQVERFGRAFLREVVEKGGN